MVSHLRPTHPPLTIPITLTGIFGAHRLLLIEAATRRCAVLAAVETMNSSFITTMVVRSVARVIRFMRSLAIEPWLKLNTTVAMDCGLTDLSEEVT